MAVCVVVVVAVHLLSAELPSPSGQKGELFACFSLLNLLSISEDEFRERGARRRIRSSKQTLNIGVLILLITADIGNRYKQVPWGSVIQKLVFNATCHVVSTFESLFN